MDLICFLCDVYSGSSSSYAISETKISEGNGRGEIFCYP